MIRPASSSSACNAYQMISVDASMSVTLAPRPLTIAQLSAGLSHAAKVFIAFGILTSWAYSLRSS